MIDVFKDRCVSPYNLSKGPDLLLAVVSATAGKTEKVRLIRNKLWQILPPPLEIIANPEHFKKEINS